VTVGAQRFDGGPGDVLVREEAHPSGLRNRKDALVLEHILRVRKARPDVLVGDAPVVVPELVIGPAVREKIDDELDGEPRALEDGFADEHGRVDDDAISPFHFAHSKSRSGERKRYLGPSWKQAQSAEAAWRAAAISSCTAERPRKVRPACRYQ